MDKHERFKVLLKRFTDGVRWLNKRTMDGTVTQKDKDDFQRSVVEPMDRMWETFTDEEKEYWGIVRYAADLFGGTVILEDPAERKTNRKVSRKRRWRKYFR